MSSIILEKPLFTPEVISSECKSTKPKKLWELFLTIPCKTHRLFGRSTLRTVPESGLFSERVDLNMWRSDMSPGDFSIETDVEGERMMDRIEMIVHIFGSSIRFDPMLCEGGGSLDLKSYEGSWTMSCMKPDTCRCNGLSGSFRLLEV